MDSKTKAEAAEGCQIEIRYGQEDILDCMMAVIRLMAAKQYN